MLAYLTKQIAIFCRDEAIRFVCLPVEGILEVLESQRVIENVDHLLRESVCEGLGGSRRQEDGHASDGRNVTILAKSNPRGGTDSLGNFRFDGTENRLFLGIHGSVLTLANLLSMGS